MKLLIVSMFLIGTSYALMPEVCYAGTGTMKRPESCCSLPILIDAAIFTKCKADNPKPRGNQKGQQRGQPKGCCMAECLLNTTGIYANGVMNKAVAQKVLSENNPAWSQVIKNAIDKCLADAAAKDADFKAMIPTTGEKNCNPISGFMVTCINGQVFKNCPVDQQTNFDAECLKLSTFADTCGMKIGKGK